MPATDPTLQTEGTLTVAMLANFNVTKFSMDSAGKLTDIQGLPIAYASTAFGPANKPPPPWRRGAQYDSYSTIVGGAMGVNSAVPSNASVAPYWTQKGAVKLLSISDMSKHAVLEGKTYTFNIPVGTPYWIRPAVDWLQLSLRITGGPNGSTVLPGFGIFNLPTNPNAWSYETPTEPFTGSWMMPLLSRVSLAKVWLSAEYTPPTKYGKVAEARLLFTVAGSGYAGFTTASPDEDLAEEEGPLGFQHLHPG